MRDTKTAVLDVAQELLQTRGYNAFSFRDLAERLGIKSASIHYYFPTKGDLCRALIARHRDQVGAAFIEIDGRETDANRKLERYAGIFRETLENGNRMCLCGMLAADFVTLDPAIAETLRQSIRDHEVWLGRVLAEGKKRGVVRFDGNLEDQARLILSTLEGAMLVARTFGDTNWFAACARRLLVNLKAKPES